jgi:hypothetical protein
MVTLDPQVKFNARETRDVSGHAHKTARARKPVGMRIDFLRLFFDVVEQTDKEIARCSHFGSGKIQGSVWQITLI